MPLSYPKSDFYFKKRKIDAASCHLVGRCNVYTPQIVSGLGDELLDKYFLPVKFVPLQDCKQKFYLCCSTFPEVLWFGLANCFVAKWSYL